MTQGGRLGSFLAQLGLILSLTYIPGISRAVPAKAAPPDLTRFTVEYHTPDQLVAVGQTITLMCRVNSGPMENDDWKVCRWRRETDKANCMYEYIKVDDAGLFQSHWEVKGGCDQVLGEVEFFGSKPEEENHICGIHVLNAGMDDNSDWSCLIEECNSLLGGCSATNGNGDIVQATMNVKVVDPTAP